MNVRPQRMYLLKLIACAGLIAALPGAASAAGPAAASAAMAGTVASIRPLAGQAMIPRHLSPAAAVASILSRALPLAASAVMRLQQRAPVPDRPRLMRPLHPGQVLPLQRMGPHITCPTDVWEGPPFLNRYDNYIDNGQGVCVLNNTTIHATTIEGSVTVIDGVNVMENAVTVDTGATLVVPAGGTIQVSGTSQPLAVLGTLTANGAATQPITFTNTAATPGSWGGVEFVPGSAGTLNFVHLSYAGTNTSVPTVGCCFTTAVFVDGANPTISNSTIDFSSNNGIEVFSSGNPTVTNDTFLSNGGHPLRYDFMPNTSFVNNRLSASGNGGGDAIDVAGGNVTSALTVTTPGLPFRYEGSLVVNPGAQLTIGAGTVMQDSGNGQIVAEGTLNAVGTASNPISLTTTNPVTGSWGGVAFVPGGTGTLSFTHLSFAGANTSVPTVGCCFRTAVLVDGSYPTISNDTIDTSGGNGVEVFGSGDPSVTGDSIVNNVGWPLRYDFTPSTSLVNNALTASGNGNGDVIDLASGNVTSTLSITTPGLPVRLEGNITVNPLATLAIGPGSVVQDNGNGELTVEGTLSAVGTATSPVSLTNTNPVAGSWGGVAFVPGGSGTLNFVHLSFAGANTSVPTVGCCFRTAVLVDGSYPTITNSTIDTSGGNGVEVFSSGDPSVTGDSIVNNANFPLKYDFTPSITLANNAIAASGNGSGDVIDIASGTITSTLDVVNPGLPLRLEGNITVNAGAQFVIGAGMVVQDNGNGLITVEGTLNAVGTASSPISLTNTNATAGSWAGIAFVGGSGGTLSFMHLSFAGANVSVPSVGCCFRSAIFVAGANPTITNDTIDTSGGNGIEVYTSGNPTISDDTIVNNGEFPLRYDATPSISLGNNGIVAGGNASGDVVDIAGGTLAGTLTLTTPGLPIRLEGSVTVNSGAQLNVGPGTVIQENGNGELVVFGTANMSGTASNPISLTNTNPTAGSWSGIGFFAGSAGVLNGVHLSFAGSNTSEPSVGCCFKAAIFVSGANPTISGSTIDASGGNDVEVRNGGQPLLRGNAFGAVPSGEFGVLNDSSAAGPFVDASYDWWGDPSGPGAPGGSGSGVAASLGVTVTPFLIAAPSAVQLTLSRASGGFGDSVAVSGTAFGPGETVSVLFDSTLLTSTVVAANGSFNATIAVPQAIAGAHSISALGQSSTLSASAAFLVTPKTFLLATKGAQHSTNVVSGYGFAPGETVKAVWKPGNLALGSRTTNALGSFGGASGLTFTVPMSTAGTYNVVSTGQSSHGVATSTFSLRPTLKIVPSSGVRGSRTTVSGTAYKAGEKVTVKWDCASPACSSTLVLGSKTANATGDFSLSVTIPTTTTVGLHTVGAKGTSSGIFAGTTYNVTS